MNRQFPKWSFILFLALLLGTFAPTANAHTRTEVGPYVLIVGWQSEPVIVGERNALIVDIHTQDEEPVAGVESTLDLEVLYAGREFRSNLSATETVGFYTAEIFPTVRGQYSVRLFGTIGNETIDVVVEPEEVFSAARIQFPEPLPDTRELQTELTAMQEALAAARTTAFIGIGFGILGTALAIFSLLRSRTNE